jgi:hypothetical protein
MTFNISNYSFAKAKLLNVDIKPSKYKNKKIDVYKNDIFICSIGDIRYYDYPTYLTTTTHKKEYAEERRRLYKLRNNKYKDKIGTAGYYAFHILW